MWSCTLLDSDTSILDAPGSDAASVEQNWGCAAGTCTADSGTVNPPLDAHAAAAAGRSQSAWSRSGHFLSSSSIVCIVICYVAWGRRDTNLRTLIHRGRVFPPPRCLGVSCDVPPRMPIHIGADLCALMDSTGCSPNGASLTKIQMPSSALPWKAGNVSPTNVNSNTRCSSAYSNDGCSGM